MAFRTSSETMRNTSFVSMTVLAGGTSANMLVSGPADAINKLRSASNNDNLALPTQYFDQGKQGFQLAVDYQIKKGTFPTLQDFGEFETLISHGLHFTECENIAEDLIARFRTITPPIFIGGFDIDATLKQLRSVTRAHHEERIYEIGLITQIAGSVADEVALIPSFPGIPATDIMWMVRRIEVNSSGSWIERWGALEQTVVAAQQHQPSPRTLPASSTLPTLPTLPTPSAKLAPAIIVHAKTSALSAQDGFEDCDSDPEDDTGEDSATVNMPPVAGTGPQVYQIDLSDLHVLPDPSIGANLTDDQLLDGHVDPDKIVGSMIFRLALTHHTSTLQTRINALYVSRGLPTRGRNTYTKRVSNAFDARAETMDPRDANGMSILIGVMKYQFDCFRYERKLRDRKPNMADYENKGKKKEDWSTPKNPTRWKKRQEAKMINSGDAGNVGPPLRRGRKAKKMKLGPESDDEET
ncbi:hypothetical protein TI39_contig490g00010 [Zymoseptoria brevis]|uniref:Uncharacterized protein n=1 Tax=Zymoseptoria brevis TaxID=1047168 RepID=A0A0F4GK63_9PEZI|nr:hypothetical protein TI39_contig490g00010 [Zymoseptoria brevis]